MQKALLTLNSKYSFERQFQTLLFMQIIGKVRIPLMKRVSVNEIFLERKKNKNYKSFYVRELKCLMFIKFNLQYNCSSN